MKRSNAICGLTVALALAASTGTSVSADYDIVYALQTDMRGDYPLQLLDLAMSKTGKTYTIRSFDLDMSQSRETQSLKDGVISILWQGTSAQAEEELIPIRVPIYRGLLGYRVCIINKDRQADFSSINAKEDIRNLLIGQGLGWSDVSILEEAGFKVSVGDYEDLFKMVANDRIDCFLRGVTEAPAEVSNRRDALPNLAVENDLLIVYPFAMFFFVSKENGELANEIEFGLKQAYADGSFLELFNTSPYIKDLFVKLNLNQRLRLDIGSSSVTDGTRKIPSHYWHGQPASNTDYQGQ